MYGDTNLRHGIMTRYHRHSFLLVVAMLLSSLLSGCAESSKDEEPDTPTIEPGSPTEVAITLSSRSLMVSGTRADGTPADPDHVNEKINDWFLVFVHNNGTVSKILKRTEAETTSTPPLEQETFKCIIPTGTYSIYAFANMTPADLKAASGVEFTLGASLTTDDQNAIKRAVWNGLNDTDGSQDPALAPVNHFGYVMDAKVSGVSNSNLNLWDIEKKGIPMTGYLPKVKIGNKIEENFSIEVVRMLAKVDLMISNNTGQDVKINSVGLDPVTVSTVSLFPNGASTSGISYDFLGNYAFTPVSGAEYARLLYTPATPWTAPKNDASQQQEPTRCRFYMKESLSERANGDLFTVWLNVTHADGVRSVVQYNVTSDIKKYINRNDWLKIPIALSKYAVQVEALFYPPIGGYPAYMSTVDPDGSQVFTFGTPGEFCIVPHVIDKETGEHLSATLYKFEVVEGSLNDPDDIIIEEELKIEPTASSLPDEIFGTLNTNEGTAHITIKVMVYNSPTDKDPAQTFYRTIHIVRDNNVVPDKTTNP